MKTAKDIVYNIMHKAGIEINGSRPWDIQVHDSRFYKRVLFKRTLGLGESYMEGWWDCDSIDEFINLLFLSHSYNRFAFPALFL